MNLLRKTILCIFWTIMALPVLPFLPVILLFTWADNPKNRQLAIL